MTDQPNINYPACSAGSSSGKVLAMGASLQTSSLALSLLFSAGAFACAPSTAGLVKRAKGAEKADNHQEACRAFHAALARPDLTGSRRLAVHRARLRCASRTGHLAALQAEARARLARRPGEPESHYVLGLSELLMATGTGAEAARHLALAQRADPGEAEYPYRLGLVLLAKERPVQATRALGEAVRLRPRWASARVAYARAWADQGNPDEVRKALESLAHFTPTLKQVSDASVLLSTLARDADPIPPAAQPQFDEAMRLLDKEYTAAAATVLKKAHEEYPRVATFALLYGLAMVRLSNYGAAIGLLQEAARRNQQDPTAPLHLASVFQELGRTKEAVTHYQEATRLDPVSRRAWRGLGETLLSLQRVGEALPALERAAALSGRNPRVLRNLGKALASAGRLREAIDLLRDAVRRDPKDVEGRYELAELLVRLYRATDSEAAAEKVFTEARALLRAIVKDAPTHEASRDLLKRLTAGAEGKERPPPRKEGLGEEGE